ncbi:MAG: UDP-2,3-diacylglucosamine diphosphatase [Gammaproteobacteria bacterium]|nr:UDP-2,3-diacylglucosamine diphosphatase [Gammaproteobacteria bacterium]
MTVAFISDLHLTPERPNSTILFEEFLRATEGIVEDLYILGDLFEYWIGDDAGEQLGHQRIEKALKQTTDRGTNIFFIHGNRDFLIGSDFANRTGCRILPDPTVIILGDNRVVLSHGDSLCTDDIEHQNARDQMLSSKWKVAFLDKSIEDRVHTAKQLRSHSEKSKQKKSMEIMDVTQAEVEKMIMEHQADIMIHGHTHRPGIHEFKLDSKRIKRYVLGDWYTQKSSLTYNNNTFLLKK